MKGKKALLFVLAFAVVTTLICAFAMIPMVFAQEPEPEPTTPLVTFFEKLANIIPVSIMMGVATTTLGYLRKTPPESFELDKFLATVIISLIMGACTLGFGWDYTVAEEWLANGCITLYIYWFAKIIAIKVGWIKLPETAPAAAKT